MARCRYTSFLFIPSHFPKNLSFWSNAYILQRNSVWLPRFREAHQCWELEHITMFVLQGSSTHLNLDQDEIRKPSDGPASVLQIHIHLTESWPQILREPFWCSQWCLCESVDSGAVIPIHSPQQAHRLPCDTTMLPAWKPVNKCWFHFTLGETESSVRKETMQSTVVGMTNVLGCTRSRGASV